MDVSVVIASYNVSRYIKQAVESALSQQGVEVEVIVVDDRSTDGTREIIATITDPRVKSIMLNRNSGPGAARNAGMDIASGEWIAILDGDDTMETGRLQRCIKRGKNENADVVVDNLQVCREEDGAEFPMFPPEAWTRLVTLDVATFIRGTLSNKNNYTLGYLKPVFSGHFLRQAQLSYAPDLRIGEDYRLLLEALLSNARCVVEPTAGYRYNARAQSTSYRLSPADITLMMKADSKLSTRYSLNKDASLAQAARTRWLKREHAFACLVEAIKKKDGHGAIKAIASYPSCIWLLRRPLQVRLKRLVA